MITDPEAFFADGCGRCARFATADCSTRQWAVGLSDLRRICRDTGMAETAKWGHPCYTHAGRNIAIIGAFRGDFRLSFFDAALLTDPHALLEKQGPNTRHADMLRFTANEQVVATEPVIRAYLSEAMANAAAGLVAPKEAQDIELPGELTEALSADPELAEAFAKLTPGRQRSYVINLSSAKKADTRRERIVRFRDRIIAGKGATER
jgi:uncharacterized protein YdeI (YjbR/CyaY-like superfamily)